VLDAAKRLLQETAADADAAAAAQPAEDRSVEDRAAASPPNEDAEHG
jgi:hypothetical protein